MNGSDRDDAAGAQLIDVQEIKLAGLIEHGGDERDGEAEARQRAVQIVLRRDIVALIRRALRADSHSRIALASRGDRSG